jgi:hypothetical protein
MQEQSHLDEMNAAIRGHRERGLAPRIMVTAKEGQAPEQAPAPPSPPQAARRRSELARLRRRL